MRKSRTVIVGLLATMVSLGSSGAAHATPVIVMSLFNWVSDVSYNATTHVFTENATIGIPGKTITLDNDVTRERYDIQGTYNLTAEVDNQGVLHGGAFSLVGTSTALGILTPTLLFTGPVIEVISSVDEVLPVDQFGETALISFEAPQILAAIGRVDFWRIHTFSAPVPFFWYSQPWATSFGMAGTHGDTSPDIIGFRDVPEPATWILGLLGLALVRIRPARAL